MIFFIARSNCLSSLPRPSLYIELSGCSILLRIRSSIPSSRDRRSTNLVALLTWLFSPPFSSFTSKWALDGLYLKLESLGFRRVETTSKRDHAPEWCSKRTNENAKLIITTIVGMVFEFFVGITLPLVSFTKINLPSGLISSLDVTMSDGKLFSGGRSPEDFGSRQFPKIYVPTNPHGAELLPPGIIVAETDFYLRRLWGEPSEDLKKKPKYLVTFTVGFEQRNNINATAQFPHLPSCCQC